MMEGVCQYFRPSDICQNRGSNLRFTLSDTCSFEGRQISRAKNTVAKLASSLLKGALRLSYPIRKPLSDYAVNVASGTAKGIVIGFGAVYEATHEVMTEKGHGAIYSTCVAAVTSLFSGAIGTPVGFIAGNLLGVYEAGKGTVTLQNLSDAYSGDKGAKLVPLDGIVILPAAFGYVLAKKLFCGQKHSSVPASMEMTEATNFTSSYDTVN